MSSTKHCKGEYDIVISRRYNISSITILLPKNNEIVDFLLKNVAGEYIKPEYVFDKILYRGIKSIDLMNVAYAILCGDIKIDRCMNVVSALYGILRAFNNLSYVDIELSDDIDIKELDNVLQRNEPSELTELFSKMYRITELKINMNDIFSEEVCEYFMRYLMEDEILPNSYLDRKFEVYFTNSEYTSFFFYMFRNNSEKIKEYDEKIVDYMTTLPTKIAEDKPNISLVFDYDFI